MPEVGEVVDDVFLVESEIDSGNFGSIYQVEDQLEKRQLALKVLRPGPHDEDELRRRFEREARLVYSLDHKHIVKVHYYGETSAGLPYMAMEYLTGTDLRTLLYHHGPLKPKLIKRITLETLSALAAAHALGIVHRDLKPANIFLVNDDDKGHVKVLDFGFAKALDDESSGEITNAGTLVGTPAYMSPELVHKKNVGPAADIYAMGLIMAEMVTGEKLVQIENVYDTILFQASGKPIKLPDEVQRCVFSEVIQKAISKTLDDRYADADEMARAIYELFGEAYQPLVPARERVFVSDSGATSSDYMTIGDAPDDDLTVPRSLGPDISDIETDVRPSYELDVEEPEPTDSATITPSDTAHGVRTPHTPVPERREPQSTPHPQVRDERRFSETLDMSFEATREPEQEDSSLLLEVLAGLVLGLIALAVLFFFVYQ